MVHIKASWTRHAASVVPAHSHACQCTTGSNRQPAPCASVLVPFYNCAAWLPRRALLQALEGVRMELIDAAYPLLAGGWARRSPVQLLKQPSGSHSHCHCDWLALSTHPLLAGCSPSPL